MSDTKKASKKRSLDTLKEAEKPQETGCETASVVDGEKPSKKRERTRKKKGEKEVQINGVANGHENGHANGHSNGVANGKPKKEKGKDKKKKKQKTEKKAREDKKEEKKEEKEEEEEKEKEEEEEEEGSGGEDGKAKNYSWSDLGEKDPTSLAGPPFSNYRINPETVKILNERGFKFMFPIQAMTYDHIYDGKDLIGRARTGSGKTLSFALPVIERLRSEGADASRPQAGRLPRVLCLSPTRELARQIAIEFDAIGKTFATVCVYGGAPYMPQQSALRRGVDVVVGTPGRIQDLLERNTLKLSEIRYVILDEADEMLNIGFKDAIEGILESVPPPDKRQTLLFSATIPPWVSQIAANHTRKSNLVNVDLVGNSPAKAATQVRHMAVCCPPQVRQETLGDVIKVYGGSKRTIVFANTKAEANELVVNSALRQYSQVLHGDIAQSQREVTLQGFRDGIFTCLVATDVAARGLDIPEVDLIIQTHPPRDKETYIHRSGRTARAGRTGTCITFFTKREVLDGELRRLENAVGTKFELIGIPQPTDMIRVAAEQVDDLLDKVHDDMLTAFSEAAQRLINQRGEVVALAAALATISGYTQPLKGRSLLTGSEHYITVLVKSMGRPIQTTSYVVTIVRNCLGSATAHVGDASLCVDGSAVVDVPPRFLDDLLSSRAPAGIEFSVAETLPPLKGGSDALQRGGSGGGRWERGGRGGNRGGRSWGGSNRYGGGGGGGYGGGGGGGGGGGSVPGGSPGGYRYGSRSGGFGARRPNSNNRGGGGGKPNRGF